MRPVTVTAGPFTAASANNIALSQSLAGAGAVTINGALASGGVATITPSGLIKIISAGNDSGITFAVVGTNWSGASISETVTGANAGTATSVLDYGTVMSITGSGATASTITVGTVGTGASPWVRFDDYSLAPVAMQFVVTGTVNFTLLSSFDDPNDVAQNTPIAPSAMTWDSSGSDVIAATATLTDTLVAAPRFAKVFVNSGSGSVKATFTQYGAIPL